jgi:hypothetical protein
MIMQLLNQKKIKNAINYFSKPYDLLNDNRIKIIYSIGGSLFILFFLWAFGPFGIALFKDIDKIKFLSLICLAGAIILIIHLYLLQNIIIKKHTIGTTIIWLSWMTLIVGVNNFIIYMIFFNHGHLIWKGLPTMLFQTFLVGLLPVLFIIVLYNAYFLKKKIRLINQINTDLSTYKSKISDKSYLTLTAKNLGEVLTVDSNSLLYIASADNYVEINWLDRGRVRKTLLRKTLKEIEKEVKNQCQHIERCHNSYIVNINKIKTISGNTGGYRIIFNNIDFPIPISRKYKKHFFKQLTANTL